MRHSIYRLITAMNVLALAGCAPQALFPGDDSILGVLLGAGGESAPPIKPDDALPRSNATIGNVTISGRVTGTGNYQLFDIGLARAGERISVVHVAGGIFAERFTVVLLDADEDLLVRALVAGSSGVGHVLRHNTDRVFVGVMPAAGSAGGDFQLVVNHTADVFVPAPARQVVWLNFAGANDLSVHRRSPIAFSSFRGETLGEAYRDHTAEIKEEIVRTMREDYAAFEVVITTSDEGPPPAGAFSTVHFGGKDSGLLGLADNVDRYNQDPRQNALVYIGTFANYSVMELEPDEMGRMIGNVASHELGHLLGLYHTRDPSDVMDSTGSAWELAGEQRFGRVSLERSVFPIGMENSARVLSETVGRRANVALLEEPVVSKKRVTKALIRAFAHDEMVTGCGTCLNLDE